MHTTRPLFPLGRILATPGALGALQNAGQDARELLARHAAGDWGTLSEDDRHANDCAITHALRLLSAYHLTTGEKIWVITEADRSATTLLRPSEY
jgi:hypothetical protein